MESQDVITVRQFLSAAIQFANDKCTVCKKGKLQLVWIGEETDPMLWYIECKRCHTEFQFAYAFTPALNIPQGK